MVGSALIGLTLANLLSVPPALPINSLRGECMLSGIYAPSVYYDARKLSLPACIGLNDFAERVEDNAREHGCPVPYQRALTFVLKKIDVSPKDALITEEELWDGVSRLGSALGAAESKNALYFPLFVFCPRA